MSDAVPENATFRPQTLLGAAMVRARAQRATKLEESRTREEEMDIDEALAAQSQLNFKDTLLQARNNSKLAKSQAIYTQTNSRRPLFEI